MHGYGLPALRFRAVAHLHVGNLQRSDIAHAVVSIRVLSAAWRRAGAAGLGRRGGGVDRTLVSATAGQGRTEQTGTHRQGKKLLHRHNSRLYRKQLLLSLLRRLERERRAADAWLEATGVVSASHVPQTCFTSSRVDATVA